MKMSIRSKCPEDTYWFSAEETAVNGYTSDIVQDDLMAKKASGFVEGRVSGRAGSRGIGTEILSTKDPLCACHG
jgi:hypothetical protein